MHPSNFKYTTVSPEALRIAQEMIRILQVQPGFGMAAFLNVPNGYDNFSSVRLWVQKKIDIQPKQYNTLGQLTISFLKCFPPDLRPALD